MWRLRISGWPNKGWKWWMRWLPVTATFSDSGCFDDSHNHGDACPCNNFLSQRRHFENQGFRVIAFHPHGPILTNGVTLIRNYHVWGR